MFCQHCGAKTQVIDTIGEDPKSLWRAKLASNVGVVRVRKCENGHDFETIEVRRIAYDFVVGNVA